VPILSIASLIGICALCKVGFKVVFTKTYCDVIYNNKVILWGTKDSSTDLWALLLKASNGNLSSMEGKWVNHMNPPIIWTTPIRVIHTFSADASKCSLVCAPIVVKSKTFKCYSKLHGVDS
jgi:hypothetical protein